MYFEKASKDVFWNSDDSVEYIWEDIENLNLE